MIEIYASTSKHPRKGVSVTTEESKDVIKGMVAALLMVSAVRNPQDGRCIIVRVRP